MLRASTEQREVAGVEDEAVVARQGRAEFVEDADRDVLECTARVAGEMLMNLTQVVHGGPVTEVGVGHDADRRQRFERSVHGGEMDLGVLGLDRRSDVLRAQMIAGVEQHADDQPARCCDPSAVRSDLVEDGIDITRGHVASLGMRPHRARKIVVSTV